MNSLSDSPEQKPKRVNPHPTALIVDDNWDNRLIAHMILENAGYVVSEASNGGEALLLLDSTRFDLMVLDLQMPVMGGEDLLRYLRSYAHHADMPVVVITAYDELITDRLASMTPYIIHKPINVIDFMKFTLQFRDVFLH